MSDYKVRLARKEDLKSVVQLQEKFHISSLDPENLSNGFVTTKLTNSQLLELVSAEGLIICVNSEGKLCGYVVAASWEWFSQWPIFKYMTEELPHFVFEDLVVTPYNSFQYGPICIDLPYRGTEVLELLYNGVKVYFKNKYPVSATFINKKNQRSFAAHTKKLGLKAIDEFDFNNNQYYRMAFLTN